MATIALGVPGFSSYGFSKGIGAFISLNDAFTSVKKATSGLVTELSNLKLTIDVACTEVNADTSLSLVQQARSREETKDSSLSVAYEKLDVYIKDVNDTDQTVSFVIGGSKRDFYKQYSYLKPECEKSTGEKIGDWFGNAWDGFCDFLGDIGDFFCAVGEWIADHWKEILLTLVIIVGAVLSIVAVVASGGVALVPLLTGILTFFGMSSATAMAVATVVSITVAVVAVVSTVASSSMNIIGTWCDMSGNATFMKWQKALNITAAVSNGLYSIGNLYNSIKGVSGKEFIARQKAIQNGKMGYGNLEGQNPRIKPGEAGKEYTSAQKKAILDENMSRNGGQLRSDQTGKILEQPMKSVKGVAPPGNEAQIDHILARSAGGANTFSNAQVIERTANIAKSASTAANFDYLFYSAPDVINITQTVFSGASLSWNIFDFSISLSGFKFDILSPSGKEE